MEEPENIHQCSGANHSGESKSCGQPHDNNPTAQEGHHRVNIEDTSGARLLLTLALNFIIPVAQVIGGFYAHSMALISDATHNFSDFTAILVSYVAYRIGKKGASVQATFGYSRAEILAALFNVVLLVAAVIFILYEAVQRLRHPEVVSGGIVMWLASIGILGNGFSAWLLHKDAGHSLNVRGAFLHMLGDLFTSVVVLINGAVLLFKPWYWLDPLLSLFIVLFILKNCWSILKEASSVLMDATPRGLNIEEVKQFLEQIPGICGVHYIHAWNLSSSSVAFSCHVVVEDQLLSDTGTLADKVRHELFHRFGIDHPVLQFETSRCGNGGLLCEISCADSSEASKPSGEPGNKRRNKKHFVFLTLRIFLGIIFVYASLDKIIHPYAFAQILSNYQILPISMINLTAMVLPWCELLIGVCLIFGFFLPGSLFLSNLLLATFFSALLLSFARGLNIECGCFNTSFHKLASGSMTWYLVRDAIFLAIAAYLFSKFCLKRDYTENSSP